MRAMRRLRGIAGTARRVAAIALAVGVPGGVPFAPPAAATVDLCAPRLLVLSAYPGEIDMFVTAASMAGAERITAGGRTFYVGELAGNTVAVALTGIGLRNARATTTTALDHFSCGGQTAITGIVFSGVAGSRQRLGDVAVPGRWTTDGQSWLAADPVMLATARQLSLQLSQVVPAGDPACAGVDPHTPAVALLEHAPALVVGGDGISGDPFGERTLPCMPGGGDVFGCEPCRAQTHSGDAAGFATGAVPFLDPSFFFGFFQNPPATTTIYDAQDMETFAVAQVAAGRSRPFIAFRGVSDGAGDPLILPGVLGFPFQFFVYRQAAADNAATATLAFLQAWANR